MYTATGYTAAASCTVDGLGAFAVAVAVRCGEGRVHHIVRVTVTATAAVSCNDTKREENTKINKS